MTKMTVVGISIGGYLQEQNGMAVSGQDVRNHAFETPPFVHPDPIFRGRDVRVRERTIHGQKQHNMVIRQHPAPKLNHCSRLNKI